jgi:hypothetical protein
MAKYYLPAFFYASVGVLFLQVTIFRFFTKRGLVVAGCIWMLGSSLFMVKEIQGHRQTISDFYARHYDVRGSVPLIAADISQSFLATRSRYRKISIIGGKGFQEGALPIQRHVNLIHGINIAVNRIPVNRVDAPERNYFRLLPDGRSAEIVLRQKIPNDMTDDDVYVFDRAGQAFKQHRVSSRYVYAGEWWIARSQSKIRLVKYSLRSHDNSGA